MHAMMALDLTEPVDRILEHAQAWAARLGAALHLRTGSGPSWADQTAMGGYPEFPTMEAAWGRRLDGLYRRIAAVLERVPEPMRGSSGVVEGHVVQGLVAAAADFDLAILATHGRRGLPRALLGSVAERVVRRCAKPVLVVHEDHRPVPLDGPIRVLFPVDAAAPDPLPFAIADRWFGDACEGLTAFVLPPLALLERSNLEGVPLLGHPHASWAEHALRTFADGMGRPDLDTRIEIGTGGNAGDDIARLAAEQEAHLVVLPTHGRDGLRRWTMGSVAERAVRSAPCAVLVVR